MTTTLSSNELSAAIVESVLARRGGSLLSESSSERSQPGDQVDDGRKMQRTFPSHIASSPRYVDDVRDAAEGYLFRPKLLHLRDFPTRQRFIIELLPNQA